MTSAGTALGAAIIAAIEAAQAQAPARLDQLSAALRGPLAAHADTVLSAVVWDLLERQHPEGLDGGDIADALALCVQDGAWHAEVEVRTLVIVLLGALGVADPAPDAQHSDAQGSDAQDDLQDGAPIPDRPSDAALRRHALLMAASLCRAAGESPSRAVRSAVAEIERAETHEMP